MQTTLFDAPDVLPKEYKEGATTVFMRDGRYYFSGDISHCGEDNIFHNARQMRDALRQNKNAYAHKNYDDPPTFQQRFDLERYESERVTLYQDDLYTFAGRDIELISTCESGRSTLLTGILLNPLRYELQQGEKVNEDTFTQLGKTIWKELTKGSRFLNGIYTMPRTITITVQQDKR